MFKKCILQVILLFSKQYLFKMGFPFWICFTFIMLMQLSLYFLYVLNSQKLLTSSTLININIQISVYSKCQMPNGVDWVRTADWVSKLIQNLAKNHAADRSVAFVFIIPNVLEFVLSDRSIYCMKHFWHVIQ